MVLSYAEEALQEKPMGIPSATVPGFVADKTKRIVSPRETAPLKVEEKMAIKGVESAFSCPANLWVVTKGKGWRERPRHLVTKASWSLPIKEWSTSCGWLFAAHSTEFYFLPGDQEDKLRCSKCSAYAKSATSQRGGIGA